MAGPTIPHYHMALRQLMEAEQPELWRWFVQSLRTSRHDTAEAELDILKSAYRLDGDGHAALAGIGHVLAGNLGLDCEVVLYQALTDPGSGRRNAGVTVLGDTAHVVFAGDLLTLLDLQEQEVVLAHELAHVWLFRHDEGAYRCLDHLMHRLAAESDAATVTETARRLRLHTEVFADRVAAQLVAAPTVLADATPEMMAPEMLATEMSAPDTLAAVVRALVKLHSGLHHVDAAAYLRQARQILEADASTSEGWTHPELHVRIACLASHHTTRNDTTRNDAARNDAARNDAARNDNIVTHLINGADDLDRLDLLGQRRLELLTARVLAGALPIARGVPGAPTERLTLHGTMFDAQIDGTDTGGATPVADEELAAASPSVRHYAAALVLDLAMLIRNEDAELSDLEQLANEARRIGVGDEFNTLIKRTTAGATR